METEEPGREYCNAKPTLIRKPGKVEIEKVANGFVVTVGCKTLVFTNQLELNKAMALYWRDPVAAEKRYCR